MDSKFRFILIAFVAVGALALSGCELEDESDATETATNTNPTGTTEPTTEPTTDTTPAGDPYAFVRIDDLSEFNDTEDGGADIDAIVLDKLSGGQFYADTVEAFSFGGGTAEELDAEAALGAPDAFEDYPAVATCRVDGGFVSLGGIGGQLVLGMESNIEAGDTLTVLEVGGCDFGGPNDAILDDIEVFVGISKEPSGQWESLGSGEGPAVSFTVPTLP